MPKNKMKGFHFCFVPRHITFIDHRLLIYLFLIFCICDLSQKKFEYGRTDRQTDRQTDRRTDRHIVFILPI